MSRIFLAIILLFTFHHCFSQDVIYKKDGTKIMVKIIDISSDYIIYAKYDMPSGRSNRIWVQDVFMVLNENGTTQIFDSVATNENEIRTTEDDLNRNPPPPEIAVKKKITARKEKIEKIERPQIQEETKEDLISDGEDKTISYSGLLFGPIVGVNFATKLYDYKLGPNPPAQSILTAWMAGINLGYQFGKYFGINSQISYKVKGDKIDIATWLEDFEFPSSQNSTWFATGEGFISTSLNYLEISMFPIIGMGDFKRGVQLQLGAGGFLGYGLGGKEKREYSISYFSNGFPNGEDVVSEENTIEFVSLYPSETKENIIYYNRFNYGLLFYGSLRIDKVILGCTVSWGSTELEFKNIDFLDSSPLPSLTKTATGTIFFNYLL